MNIPINKKLRTPEILAALFDLDGTLLDANEEIPNNILNKIILISKIILLAGFIFTTTKNLKLNVKEFLRLIKIIS